MALCSSRGAREARGLARRDGQLLMVDHRDQVPEALRRAIRRNPSSVVIQVQHASDPDRAADVLRRVVEDYCRRPYELASAMGARFDGTDAEDVGTPKY